MGKNKREPSFATVQPNGSAIRSLRKAQGFKSQEELADKADISLRTLRNLEHDVPATPYIIRCVANALNVAYSALVIPDAEAAFEEERRIAMDDAYKGVEIAIKGDVATLDFCTDIHAAIAKVAEACGLKYRLTVTLITSGSIKIQLRIHKSDLQRLMTTYEAGMLSHLGVLSVAPAPIAMIFWIEPLGNSRLTSRFFGAEYFRQLIVNSSYPVLNRLSDGALDMVGGVSPSDPQWDGRYAFHPDKVPDERPFLVLRASLDEAFQDGRVRVRAIVDGVDVAFMVGARGSEERTEVGTP
jgi:transcriptional regulator with XRE-family HTH domain